MGECKHCGEKRSFRNSVEEVIWSGNKRSARMQDRFPHRSKPPVSTITHRSQVSGKQANLS